MDDSLFNELKKWRLEKSKELKIPAYCIFHNKTLEELSEANIQSKSDLLQIKGIGTTTVESYGDGIIDIIKNHNPLEEIKEEIQEEKEETNVIFLEKPKKKVVTDVTKERIVKINIEPEIEQRIRNYVGGKASEMVIKHTLINSGYSVLRGENWLHYHLKKKPEYFRDEEQIKRVLDCVFLCDKTRIGLPDFFVFSDTDEF